MDQNRQTLAPRQPAGQPVAANLRNAAFRRRMPLARRLRLARLEAAVTRLSTVLMAGFFVIQTMLVWLLAERGGIRSDAWIGPVAIGVTLVGIKIFLDDQDKEIDAGTLREVVSQHLELSGIRDHSVARMLDAAVECRVRLDVSQVETGQKVGTSASEVLVRIDNWFDAIGTLARRVDRLLAEAAVSASQHAAQIPRVQALQVRAEQTKDAALAAQIRRTIQGIEAQLKSADDLAALAERGYLRLESSVSELQTISSNFAQMQSRGEDIADGLGLDDGIKYACDQIENYLRAVERLETAGSFRSERPTS